MFGCKRRRKPLHPLKIIYDRSNAAIASFLLFRRQRFYAAKAPLISMKERTEEETQFYVFEAFATSCRFILVAVGSESSKRKNSIVVMEQYVESYSKPQCPKTLHPTSNQGHKIQSWRIDTSVVLTI
uniref:AlNc14C95G5828 protein n=1 Tax=Albugo laibachii Nc14 TaxID=890382 RepID=F0WGV2_9STRA|nr:AlNc14C95G5828 [Albugo laibachii Nc14]|eukprot:CCA20467.1 AlNc14C95G5828 [Albugo laibachii Nc14]